MLGVGNLEPVQAIYVALRDLHVFVHVRQSSEMMRPERQDDGGCVSNRHATRDPDAMVTGPRSSVNSL
jgi:hypothetical protein